MLKPSTALIATAIGACATSAVSCGRSETTIAHTDGGSVVVASSPSSSASAAVTHGVPIPVDQIAKVVNPGNFPIYAGPTGTVRGVVTVTGDRAPDQSQVLAKIPPKCAAAKDMYGKLFREGENRTLADVLVAVTGYRAYVPAREPAHPVEARNCSWGTRTIAITFGQRIEVSSKDREAYLPDLYGGSMPAQVVALPGGDPVQIYPTKPPRYTLADTLHPFMKADVFVLKYPTAAVTDLDGKYEISGVPVGDLTVSAVLPVTMQTASKDVKVVADQAVEVNLEIPYPGRTAPGGSAATLGSAAAPTSAASARAGGNAKPKAPVRAATPH